MKATIYKDKNNNEIRYGDMLKSEAIPNLHLIMCKEQGKDMFYVSGMDEFQEISEWQTEEDKKENKLSDLEIFSWMECRYENIYRKLPFDACLTFDEIKRLYEISKKHIENQDYGFAPVMHLIFTPDDEFPEYQKVKTKLEQILQDIKAIAEKLMADNLCNNCDGIGLDANCQDTSCPYYQMDKILQKITKAEEE